jgi:hypothetical protein
MFAGPIQQARQTGRRQHMWSAIQLRRPANFLGPALFELSQNVSHVTTLEEAVYTLQEINTCRMRALGAASPAWAMGRS